MLERRPLWALIVLLNICVVIWRMQEPAMLNVEYVDGNGNGNGVENANAHTAIGQKQQIANKRNSDVYKHYPAAHYNHQNQQQIMRERQEKRVLREYKNQPEWSASSRSKIMGKRNFIAEQQLYAGKHLLADSAEASELAAKVTRNVMDDSSIHMTSSSSTNSIRSSSSGSGGSIRSTSRSSNGIGSSSSRIKYKSKKKAFSTLTTLKSTPSPLVTAATLKNFADLQTTTTTTTTAGSAKRSTTTTTLMGERAFNFPPDDYEQLIDLHDFTYLINQPSCSRDTQALILVHSAPANEEKRRLIRDTWGNTDLLPQVNGHMPLRIIFLLGTVASEAQQLDIERENFENGDIVQGAFVDSYRNMTYKHVMAFKWFLYNCAHAQLLLKVDDDVYVNTPQLLIYLQRTELEINGETPSATNYDKYTADSENSNTENSNKKNSLVRSIASELHMANDSSENNTRFQYDASHMLFHHPQNLLFCKTNINAQVKRSFRSKWRVTVREHAGRYYPPYCPGFAIIYSTDVVLRLYLAAQQTQYFWIDDVHITGILAQNQSINITNAHNDILYKDDCENLLNGVVNSEDKDFLYAWHMIEPAQTQKLWQLYLAKARRYFATLEQQQQHHHQQLHSTAKKTSYSASSLSSLSLSSSTYDLTEFNKYKSYR